MSTPTPGRPHPPDDLDQAYARAHALAGDGTGPRASVRANVLATAREVALQAEAMPPLALVAPAVSDVGRGRAGAWNLSSWRVRSGAALCAVLLVGLAAVRFDARRRGADVVVAQAGAPVAMAVAPAAPPPRDMPPPPASPSMLPAPQRSVAVPAPTVDVAPVAQGHKPPAEAAGRDPERVVARADRADRAARAPADASGVVQAAAESTNDLAPPPGQAHADSSPVVLALASPAPERAYARPPAPAPVVPAPAPERRMVPVFAPAPAATMQAAAVPAPATTLPAGALPAPTAQSDVLTAGQEANADKLQRVEVTGGQAGFSSLGGSPAPRGSDEAAQKVSRAVVTSAIGAAAHAQPAPPPTPLHVAANADDVDALRRLLADPATRVDATDAEGRTPLQLAVMAGHVRAVRLLLAAGADPDHADATGATPRGIARTGPDADIAALLAARR